MTMKEICPCPNLKCPNHGNCQNCTSRHTRLGNLNYCAFQTILPKIEQVIANSDDSKTKQELEALISPQLQAYEKLMLKHGLSLESQARLFKRVTEYSDY